MPNETFIQQRRYSGLNLYTAVQDLGPSELTQSDNAVNYGGEMVSRPGFQACLSTVLGAAVYAAIEFVRADGTTIILCVAGGKVYSITKGTLPYTTAEIKIGGTTSFNLNSTVELDVEGKYAYVVDGARSITDLVIATSGATSTVTSAANPFQAGDGSNKQLIVPGVPIVSGFTSGTYPITSVNGSHVATVTGNIGTALSTGGVCTVEGPLYRINVNTDGTYTAVAVTGLTAPTTAPNVSLTNTTVDAFSTTTGWTADYITSQSTTVTVTGGTNATPIVAATSGAHGCVAGDVVYVTGVTGNTTMNGTWRVGTVADSTHMQLLFMDGSNSVGNGTYGGSPTLIRLGTTSALTAGAGTNLLPQQGLFTSWAQAGGNWVNNGAAGWTGDTSWGGGTLLLGVSPNIVVPDGSTVQMVQLDVIVDGFILTSGMQIPNYQLASDPTRYARDAYVSVAYNANIVGRNVDVIVDAYSDTAATTLLTTRQITLTATVVGVQTLAGVVSFGDIDTAIRSWRIRYHCGQNQNGTGGTSANRSLGQLVFYPIVGNGSLATPGGTTFSLSGSLIAIDAQPVSTLKLPTTKEYVAGLHWTKDFTASGATAKTITAATNAAPIVVTSAAHGFSNGDIVAIRGVLGNTAANGVWTVANKATNTFELSGSTGNGVWISGGTATLLTVVDFSNTLTIDVGFKPLMLTAPTDFLFRFGLRNVTGITYSVLAMLSSDGTYFSADISALSTAQRQAIGSIDIVAVNDLTVSGATKPLFALGPLTNAGNLTIDSGDYVTVITEAQDTSKDTSGVSTGVTDDGVVESNPSPASAIISPTPLSAQMTETLPAFTNSAANYFYVYRLGGPFSATDPIATYRLIAKLPRWSNTIDPSSPGAAYCTWDFSTRRFTDNTPDAALFSLVPTLASGHDAPPTGAEHVTGYRGRLALSKKSTVYISSILNTDAAAALYYPTVNIPNDPAGDTKGWIAPITPNDNDKILGMVENGDYLYILKGRTIALLSGDTPTNYAVNRHLKRAGAGLAASKAFTVVGTVIWFQGVSAVWAYQGGETEQKMSLAIEPSLAPHLQGNAAILATYVASSVALYAGERFYLCTPGLSTSTSNDTVWMYDRREHMSGALVGWTRLYPPSGVAFTSACTMAAQQGTDDVYFGGSDGQLYQHTGSGDVTTVFAISGATNATPIVAATTASHGLADGDRIIIRGVGGNTAANTGTSTHYAKRTGYSATTFGLYSDSTLTTAVAGNGVYTSGGCVGKAIAVTATVKSRGMGQEQGGKEWFATDRPTRMLAKFTTLEAANVTVTCSAGSTTNTTAITHTAPSGVSQTRDKVGVDVRGDAILLTVAASTVTPFRLTSTAVETADGAVRGST